MHFQGLNLNLLVSLDALLTEKSVTRAAERVHVTQPAMSAALNQLRQHLGDPLLQQVGRQLELTPRARILAEPVKDLLVRITTVLTAEPVFAPATARRTFRIAMSGAMVELVGVQLIRHLMTEAPFISVHIVDLAADSLRDVEEGRLDFCVTMSERALSTASDLANTLSSEHLYSDEFVIVAAAGNAAVFDGMTYDEFCGMPYVELRLSGELKSIPNLVLDRESKRPPTVAWMPSPYNVLAALSGSSSVAVLPSRLFELHRTKMQLKRVAPPFALPPVRQQCFWHPRNDIDDGHRWFRETVRRVAERSLENDGEMPGPSDQGQRAKVL